MTHRMTLAFFINRELTCTFSIKRVIVKDINGLLL